jgi:hypothetical protein
MGFPVFYNLFGVILNLAIAAFIYDPEVPGFAAFNVFCAGFCCTLFVDSVRNWLREDD